MYEGHRRCLEDVVDVLQLSMPAMKIFGYLVQKKVLHPGDEAYNKVRDAGEVEERRRQLLNFMLERTTSLAAFLHFCNGLFVHCRDLYDILRASLGK